MNNQVLTEAIEDIKLIKQVIGNTTESLLSLGKIFLWWGVLFLSNSLYTKFFIFNNYDLYIKFIKNFPLIFSLINPLYFLIGITIYFVISRKLPLIGLSKKIMNVWLFIIGFNIIVPYLVMSHDNQLAVTMFQIKTPILLTTFAIGLYFTYVLLGLKFIKWMGIVYIIAGFFAFLPGKVPYNFFLIVWPLTLLVLGIYFSYRNKLVARGN